MTEPLLSSPRKRRRSEPPQLTETSQPVSKKQRLDPASGSQPPPAFWDNLSKIWLTKGALRELDRRNARATPSPPYSPYRSARRPVTRNLPAKSKKNRQTAQYTADYISPCEPRILEDIRIFARHGGPDLSDLRNVCVARCLPVCAKPDDALQYPEATYLPNHTMSSSQSSSQSRQQGTATASSTKPTTNTTKTKTTGVYNRNFQQHLVDNAVHPYGYEYPDGRVISKPDSWKDINQILAQPRASLSPSKFTDEEYERFVRADANAAKEKQVSESVIPIIEGKIADIKCRSGGIPFNNFDPLTDGTLKPGNPDIYYGARPEQLSRKVRDDLSGQIIPSTQHDLPMAPNFFLAAKGLDGSPSVAGRQACYDGALGARGMHSLQSYKRDEPVYDSNAYTMTSIYQSGTLKMYANHVTSPCSPGHRPEYHVSQLGAYAMTHNTEACRDGIKAYRNGRDWCKVKRDEAIRQVNQRANLEAEATTGDTGASPALSFVTAVSETEAYTMSQESQTSLNADSSILRDLEESDSSIEDLADYRLPAKRSGKRSERSQTQRKRRNADVSSGAGDNDESSVVPVSHGSAGSNVTAEQTEKWSWINGKFQCHKGEDLVKEQSDTPADVWIYFDQGWPGQGEKKCWRLWISTTREILYSK